MRCQFDLIILKSCRFWGFLLPNEMLTRNDITRNNTKELWKQKRTTMNKTIVQWIHWTEWNNRPLRVRIHSQAIHRASACLIHCHFMMPFTFKLLSTCTVNGVQPCQGLCICAVACVMFSYKPKTRIEPIYGRSWLNLISTSSI